MLNDQQLLARLTRLSRMSRRIDVAVILLLIKVEDRRLHLQAACSSLHDFCKRRLRWSEGTTHRRIEAARVARRCPSILEHLRSGAITLSALAQIRMYVEEPSVDEWVSRVAGKSRRQIEELLADRAPKPDVPTRIRPLPVAPALPLPTLPTPAAPTALASPAAPAAPTALASPAAPQTQTPPQVRVEPLGGARWKVQLMVRQALHDKLERAQALMRHTNPSGDLAVVLEAALDALLEDLEKARRPAAAPLRLTRASATPGAVTLATRREVFARDGERCTFVSADGERCAATTRLEVDHIIARARGGSGELANLRLRCRAHNQLHAENTFGRAHVERRIRERKHAHRTSTVEVNHPRGDRPDDDAKGARDG